MWYDMFSWQGFNNWWWDCFGLNFLGIWEVIKAFVRDGGGTGTDWTWLQSSLDDPVDKNSLLPQLIVPDRYDFNYWSSQENGIDCNGNVGKGNYCYCPSQGYICECQPQSWARNVRRTECFDHYGYNCNGNMVDGEKNWCWDTNSTFYYLNQQLK